MQSDDLRLAVLSVLIGEHGPIPCIHVARVREYETFAPGAKPSASGRVPSVLRYRCEASELRLREGQVILELRMIGSTDHPCRLPEPTTFLTARPASEARDRLCNVLLCLPWDRTPLGRPLDSKDAAVALRHIQASSKGVKILPRSTEEISAWTFENHTETTPDE